MKYRKYPHYYIHTFSALLSNGKGERKGDHVGERKEDFWKQLKLISSYHKSTDKSGFKL